MDLNEDRSSNFVYKFHLNGLGHKKSLNAFPSVLSEAGHVAEEIQLETFEEMETSGTSQAFILAKHWIETGTILEFENNNRNVIDLDSDSESDNEFEYFARNEEDIDNDIVKLFLPTAIFSIDWVFYKYIRKVLYFMWKSKFDKPVDGSTSPEIIEMIQTARLRPK